MRVRGFPDGDPLGDRPAGDLPFFLKGIIAPPLLYLLWNLIGLEVSISGVCVVDENDFAFSLYAVELFLSAFLSINYLLI